jgi:glycogen operon protein
MEWYDQTGSTMSIDQWTDPSNRTLQYVAASTPEHESFNRILLMVHGNERPVDVTLPVIEGVASFVSLWSSEDDTPHAAPAEFLPGEVVTLAGTSMRLFRAE